MYSVSHLYKDSIGENVMEKKIKIIQVFQSHDSIALQLATFENLFSNYQTCAEF